MKQDEKQDQKDQNDQDDDRAESDQGDEQGGTVQAGGFWTWYAVLVGIVAWMVHITALASMVQWACNVGGVLWIAHLATVVTAAATAYGMWLSLQMINEPRADEAAGDLAGSTVFLGRFALITGGFSLALILLEGSYVFFLSPCV